jgi:hypothetical protein
MPSKLPGREIITHNWLYENGHLLENKMPLVKKIKSFVLQI